MQSTTETHLNDQRAVARLCLSNLRHASAFAEAKLMAAKASLKSLSATPKPDPADLVILAREIAEHKAAHAVLLDAIAREEHDLATTGRALDAIAIATLQK